MFYGSKISSKARTGWKMAAFRCTTARGCWFDVSDLLVWRCLTSAFGYLSSVSNVIMSPTVGKGAISVAFVRLSVRPSVAYVANNSRTRRSSVPKFGRKVPHLRCDSYTSFKVKRSKVRVGGGRRHTVSAESGGHTVCWNLNSLWWNTKCLGWPHVPIAVFSSSSSSSLYLFHWQTSISGNTPRLRHYVFIPLKYRGICTEIPAILWRLILTSDVKFHEIFYPEIFNEIFHEIFLKYFKNFTMFFPALHSPV